MSIMNNTKSSFVVIKVRLKEISRKEVTEAKCILRRITNDNVIEKYDKNAL